MARNEVYRDADHLVLPVAAGVESGDPVQVGDLVGVAQTDRDADGNATVWLKGAHRLDVTGAIAAVGTPVYINSGGTLTATATDNTLFGHALETKGSGNAPIVVRVARV
jgi:predicted RecA/RadA family phage recombinase